MWFFNIDKELEQAKEDHRILMELKDKIKYVHAKLDILSDLSHNHINSKTHPPVNSTNTDKKFDPTDLIKKAFEYDEMIENKYS